MAGNSSTRRQASSAIGASPSCPAARRRSHGSSSSQSPRPTVRRSMSSMNAAASRARPSSNASWQAYEIDWMRSRDQSAPYCAASARAMRKRPQVAATERGVGVAIGELRRAELVEAGRRRPPAQLGADRVGGGAVGHEQVEAVAQRPAGEHWIADGERRLVGPAELGPALLARATDDERGRRRTFDHRLRGEPVVTGGTRRDERPVGPDDGIVATPGEHHDLGDRPERAAPGLTVGQRLGRLHQLVERTVALGVGGLLVEQAGEEPLGLDAIQVVDRAVTASDGRSAAPRRGSPAARRHRWPRATAPGRRAPPPARGSPGAAPGTRPRRRGIAGRRRGRSARPARSARRRRRGGPATHGRRRAGPATPQARAGAAGDVDGRAAAGPRRRPPSAWANQKWSLLDSTSTLVRASALSDSSNPTSSSWVSVPSMSNDAGSPNTASASTTSRSARPRPLSCWRTASSSDHGSWAVRKSSEHRSGPTPRISSSTTNGMPPLRR